MNITRAICACAAAAVVLSACNPDGAVVHATMIRIDQDNVDNMHVGDKLEFSATVYPENATDKSYTWSTDDHDMSVIALNGNTVKAIAPGMANITATSRDGGHIDTRYIIVIKDGDNPGGDPDDGPDDPDDPNAVHVTGLSLNKTTKDMTTGDTFQLKADIKPSDASNKKVKWSSSDETIVCVTEDGFCASLREGSATVTAESVDGGFTAKCSFTVKHYLVINHSYNGKKTAYEFIDLGIGKTLWCNKNLLADEVCSNGGTYAWGDVTPNRSSYLWSNYIWGDATKGKLKRYCIHSEYGKVDNKTELDPSDDPANKLMQGKYPVYSPSDADVNDLFYCTTPRFVSVNGHTGTLIVSDKNGRAFFLPDDYVYNDNGECFDEGSAYYWTRTLDYSFSDMARTMVCYNYEGEVSLTSSGSERYSGCSIRPVYIME